MTVAEFVAEDWIDRLALALQGLAIGRGGGQAFPMGAGISASG